MTGGANRFIVDERSGAIGCYWCRVGLALGEEAASCLSCGYTHHARCWDAYGCNGAPTCINRRQNPYQQPNQYGQGGYAPQVGYYPPQNQYPQGGYQPPGYYPQHNPYGASPPAAPQQRMNLGEARCPTCGDVTSGYCFRCGNRSAGNAFYPVIRETAKEATEALWCGIIGLFCFGIILGPVAIYKGIQARKVITENPMLTGDGLATAGIALGALAIVLNICGVFAMIANN